MDSVSCPINSIWQQCCQILRERLGVAVFNMWFDPATVKPQSIDDNQFILLYPPNSFVDWAENYRPQIEQSLLEVTGKELRVVFRVPGAASAEPAPARPARRPLAPKVTVVKEPSQPAVLKRLNRLYSFDSFVVGENNRFAFNTCKEVAAAPGKNFNPLFIHGASGLGKTHLMQSIAREIVQQNPSAVVEYLSSEQFGNLYVEACFDKERGRNAMAQFRQRFRHVDVLLLDDVQFFSGKEAMQEEFFHTFNALYDNHKQIVCASDRMPQEISDLSKRLLSRFEWGLAVDITKPDLELRVAILEQKQQVFEQKLPAPILRYLAARIKSNVRNLESSLLTLHSYLSMTPSHKPEDLTKAMVDKVVGLKFEADAAELISVDKIMECVAHHFDVRIQDIKGKSRLAEITLPRQVAMFLTRKLTDKSLPTIADCFNKSHPTVMHSIDIVQTKMDKSDEFRQVVANIERTLCEH